jgi:capsular polysaccharide export protein
LNSVGGIRDKNILLLQGPMGDFFKQLDAFFRKNGAKTFRIALNGGDWLFATKYNLTSYFGTKDEWSEFLIKYLKQNKIDKIFLFGDCRFYQNIAIKESQKLGIETFVFEEGYVRPNYVTMEKWGVNNFSLIPREPQFYLTLDEETLVSKDVISVHPSYFKLVYSAIFYYLAMYIGKIFYTNYEHHRDANPFLEAFYGVRGLYRKYKYKFLERNILNKLKDKEYFFVPLQTYNDFQLKVHSPFCTIEEFIEIILESFAKNKKTSTCLVFKHHPVDRGRKDYKNFIKELLLKYNIEEDRIFVVYDLNLPSLLKSTQGTITINSTVGLQAMYHNSAVKVL